MFWSFGDDRGQLLVFDETSTYGVRAFDWVPDVKFSPMFFPGRKGYLLFRDEHGADADRLGTTIPFDGKTEKYTWAGRIPVRVRAMVLADQTLFVAGPPDVVDSDDPWAAFEGREGGALWAVSAESGSVLNRYSLVSPPVFDGMIAAGGRLYISTESGTMLCYGP